MKMPKGSRLTLVGVVHRDPRGEQRVGSIIEQIACDAVALEVSEYAHKWRLENGLRLAGRVAQIVRDIALKTDRAEDELLNHGEVQGVLETLLIPFEVRAAVRYQMTTGNPFYLLDDSSVSERLLSVIEKEMVSETNITGLVARSDFDYQESIDRLYEECSRFLECEPVPRHKTRLSDETIALNEQRDELIANRLFQLMSDVPGHWAYVCGFAHMIRSDGFENIAARFPEAKRVLAINDPVRRKNGWARRP
jgi:hypothetical protein